MTGRTIYDKDLVRKDPSNKYLFKQFKAKEEVVFVCYRKEVRGVITKLNDYNLKVEGRKIILDKLYILYCFKPESLEVVKQNVEIDEDVVEEKLRLAEKKEDRLEIPDEILQKCFEEKRIITVTIRNGHILKGFIFSYGIFSISLQIDKKNQVVIFRHSIYDIEYKKK